MSEKVEICDEEYLPILTVYVLIESCNLFWILHAINFIRLIFKNNFNLKINIYSRKE